MELRHIRYFLEVAETLNFSRAGDRLRITQPALSKQIRELEEELGAKLFHRTTTKVSLTEAGEYFRQQTRRVLVQLDIAASGVQQMARGSAGTLRIGCDWRAQMLPIATAARRLRDINSKINVQFVEMRVHEHVIAVRNHVIDVGFALSIFLGDTADLELQSLPPLKLKVALPRGHRLANRTQVDLRDLKNERWLAMDAEGLPGFRVLMAQILQYTPKYGVTTTSLPGLVAHVVAGDGIGLIPEGAAVSPELDLVAIDTNCTPLLAFAVWLKEGGSPLVPSYVNLLQQLLPASPSNKTHRASQ